MPPRPRRPPKQRPPDPTSTESDWRLFVAVPLPEAATALVAALVAELAGEGWPVRWVAPETAHLTLHFLGDTSPERAELLRLALAPVIARHAAFDLRTADLGVFPSLRRPRVLWLGLHGPVHRLETLQRAIGGTLRELAFPIEEGPFNPHITLGRVRDLRGQEGRDLPDAIRRRLAPAAKPSPVPVPVREVRLYRSFLSKDGARHETVGRYPLAVPGPAENPA